MAPDTDNSIEALLEQRSQYEQWLTKLDSAANKAPDAVRKKVRADYEVRLRGVIERLRGHSATIAEDLQRHQGAQRELDAHRREAEEELAEAEVRHTVGEFQRRRVAPHRRRERAEAGWSAGATEDGGGRDREAGGGARPHRRVPQAGLSSGRGHRALAAAASTPAPSRAGGRGSEGRAPPDAPARA